MAKEKYLIYINAIRHMNIILYQYIFISCKTVALIELQMVSLW